MYSRERCLTPQKDLSSQETQNVFEQTARFCLDSNKENGSSINTPNSRFSRRVYLNKPVLKIARPAYKEKFYFPAKELTTEPIEAITRQDSRTKEAQTSTSKQTLAMSILLERDFSHNSTKLSPDIQKRPESVAFGNYHDKILDMKGEDQVQQQDDENMFNFTFSPSKKPARNEEGENSNPQSEVIEDNFVLDSQREDAKDQPFPFGWYQIKKSSASPNRVNKIRVVNMLSENNNLSPTVVRPVKGRPKAHSEFKQLVPPKFEQYDENSLKGIASLKNTARNSSAQRRRPTRNEYQLSPLLCARDQSPMEKSYEFNESPPSPILLREARCKLPAITTTKRSSSSNARPGSQAYKFQGLDEKLGNSRLQSDSESYFQVPVKLGLNNYSKVGFEDNSRLVQKLETTSALESHRNVNPKFRAEEMILKKIFRSPY